MESFKIKGKAALLLCLLCSVFSGCVHAIMPLPEGVDYQSKGYCVRAENIEFLAFFHTNNFKQKFTLIYVIKR